MKSAFTFGEAALTGLTFSDITVSYCKDLSGNNVSQAGMTLTELGAGDYIIDNPNVTTDTVCRIYVTATPTKRAVVMFEVNIATLIARTGGAGNTAVNHDTGGVDNLRYVDSNGSGIDNASIVAFLKSDYDAGLTSEAYSQASSTTNADGRWTKPMYLDTGFTYTIVFFKQNYFQTSTKEISI